MAQSWLLWFGLAVLALGAVSGLGYWLFRRFGAPSKPPVQYEELLKPELDVKGPLTHTQSARSNFHQTQGSAWDMLLTGKASPPSNKPAASDSDEDDDEDGEYDWSATIRAAEEEEARERANVNKDD